METSRAGSLPGSLIRLTLKYCQTESVDSFVCVNAWIKRNISCKTSSSLVLNTRRELHTETEPVWLFENGFNNKPVQVKPSSDDKTRQLISLLDSAILVWLICFGVKPVLDPGFWFFRLFSSSSFSTIFLPCEYVCGWEVKLLLFCHYQPRITHSLPNV